MLAGLHVLVAPLEPDWSQVLSLMRGNMQLGIFFIYFFSIFLSFYQCILLTELISYLYYPLFILTHFLAHHYRIVKYDSIMHKHRCRCRIYLVHAIY